MSLFPSNDLLYTGHIFGPHIVCACLLASFIHTVSELHKLCFILFTFYFSFPIYIPHRQCVLLRKFKGPFALPIVGNCYQAEALYLLRYLGKLRKRFGKMFTFFAFTKPYLVVCDPNVVRRVLSDTRTFSKGSDYTSQFSVAFGQGLVTSNGEKHKTDRACFGKYFIRSNIAKYLSRVNEYTVKAMTTMFPTNTSGNGAEFNIEEFFARLSLRVFMAFSVATDYGDKPEREKEICHIVSKGSWAMGRMITLGLPMWNIFPTMKYIHAARTEIWKDMKPVLEARREAMKKDEIRDVDDCLTAMITDNLSDVDVIDHMVTLICAGHDTTAFFSAYMCLLLAEHPDCQEQLR